MKTQGANEDPARIAEEHPEKPEEVGGGGRGRLLQVLDRSHYLVALLGWDYLLENHFNN